MRAIEVEWGGEEYVIPENEAFEVGEAIEDVIALSDLPDLAKRPRFRKIARVYGIILRHAGASVTDAQIHGQMMDQLKSGDADAENMLALQAMAQITEVLMDGAPEVEDAESGKKGGAS